VELINTLRRSLDFGVLVWRWLKDEAELICENYLLARGRKRAGTDILRKERQ
jgi:hypothetical protein